MADSVTMETRAGRGEEELPSVGAIKLGAPNCVK